MQFPCFFTALAFALGASSGVQAVDPLDSAQYFTLVPVVKDLRLRAGPSPNAKVITIIPDDYYLQYLNETAGEVQEVTLRGEKRRGRWLKVLVLDKDRYYSSYHPVIGWVFGGAVRIKEVQVSQFDTLFKAEDLNCDLFRVQRITSAQFEVYKSNGHSSYVNDIEQHKLGSDTSFIDLRNGKRLLITNKPCHFDESKDEYTYAGQDPKLGVFYVDFGCGHREIYNNKTIMHSLEDSRVLHEFEGLSGIPDFSPDHQWSAGIASGDCGNYYALDFTYLGTQQSPFQQPSFRLVLQAHTVPQIYWTGQERQIAVEWVHEESQESGYYLMAF